MYGFTFCSIFTVKETIDKEVYEAYNTVWVVY